MYIKCKSRLNSYRKLEIINLHLFKDTSYRSLNISLLILLLLPLWSMTLFINLLTMFEEDLAIYIYNICIYILVLRLNLSIPVSDGRKIEGYKKLFLYKQSDRATVCNIQSVPKYIGFQ